MRPHKWMLICGMEPKIKRLEKCGIEPPMFFFFSIHVNLTLFKAQSDFVHEFLHTVDAVSSLILLPSCLYCSQGTNVVLWDFSDTDCFNLCMYVPSKRDLEGNSQGKCQEYRTER